MKHKILYSILTLFLGTFGVFAQNDDLVIWGLKASVDAELPGKWHRDGGSVNMYSRGYGFTIGGVSNIYLGNNFYFEPALAISYSQYRYKDLLISDSEGEFVEANPKIYKWGIQVPLVIGYSIGLSNQYSLNVFTGPQIRYSFVGDITFRDKDKEVQKDAYEYINLYDGQRRFDLSWKIGVGLPVNNFMISLEADLGITDLLKNNFSFRENRVGIGVTYYL